MSDLRRRNRDDLKGLSVHILRQCQKAGMVSLGHVALDGTKVKANASNQKALSHERMLKAEILDLPAPGVAGGEKRSAAEMTMAKR